jgi:hypothetical protein|tara:strand:+ start:278 stop:724 length:447 start_codon:yes stop_codon:yes gene_type:complete
MILDEILKMWSEDVKIDDLNLDEETTKSAKLHSKYLELFTLAKLQLKRNETEMNKLRKNKWLYFSGKMTKEEMDKLGWQYDPFNGMTKPLKSDMDMYYNSDEDIIRVSGKIDYQKMMVEVLEEIMNNLRWRHTNIKNILEFKKFTSGV